MRFHVVSLPHTTTTRDYSSCAYTEKVRKFCDMMWGGGHEIFLYAGDDNDADVTEHVSCISKKTQSDHGFDGPADIHKIEWSGTEPYWREFNLRAAAEISKRKQDRDFLCLISGTQEIISTALPELQCVEFGVGYRGVFAPFRVFESYAFMHAVSGDLDGTYTCNVRDYDCVIPNYYEAEDFWSDVPETYLLYIGRITDRKGWRIAQRVAEHLGRPFIVAGAGDDFDGYGEYVGSVGPERRTELMAQAHAVMVPTQYLEPFGGVHAEAMLCGTPVITSDFGAFTETVTPQVGRRCRSLADYVNAVGEVKKLDRDRIQRYARSKFSYDAVRPQYERYFEKVATVWGDGWNTLPPKKAKANA